MIRVFPHSTKATPRDDLAFVGDVPLLRPEEGEVRVSVAFTWDLREAERLARSWGRFYPVTVGGPATGERSGDFVPGQFLRHGYVITSRGCPNRCWFCTVWRREGPEVRELPIADGWNVVDDNLLACSDDHVRRVFAMLSRQPHKAEFTGGLDAALLKPWHARELAKLEPKSVYLAFDEPADEEPLRVAADLLREAGLVNRARTVRAFVLVGYPRDSFQAATERLRLVVGLGIMPMAMLWRDERGDQPREWRRFARSWARPYLIGMQMMSWHTQAESSGVRP